MREIELTGLDGSNLLAYLAALGTLRVLTLAEPDRDLRMSWVERGFWMPVIHGSGVDTVEAFLGLLAHLVCGEESVDEAWKIGKDLTLPCAEFGERMREAVENAAHCQRGTVDFLAAFGSDVYGAGPKKELMSDTGFRTMSGAGHQHFLGFMHELAAGTDVGHIRRSLFAAWDYADGRPSLRWDAADFRPHALRAVDPSGDPIKTMRGANRLAIEALPLFPTAPQGRRIRTTGFQDGDDGTEVWWPIWTEAIELGTVASLLAAGEERVRAGVAQVFRSVRFTEGKYRNFSPSKATL
ncbi:conserved hypothetical protein [Candidatus Sulfopaludibacter sp. SbA3]|nr:conserved hypothetical protein [Candidatus Sulfopaludibacter sp. SbA3]